MFDVCCGALEHAVDEDVVAREVGGEVCGWGERGGGVAGEGGPEEGTGDGVARAEGLEGGGVVAREDEEVGLDCGCEERCAGCVGSGAAGEAEG